MTHDPASAPLVAILADPRNFAHHLDLAAGRLLMVATSREKLARQPFVDGREPFSTGSAVELRLEKALGATWQQPPGPDRMIFHMAFCGSTLLATLLDQPGRSFVLREPNILVDLANGLAAGRREPVLAALPLVRDLLRRRWSEQERVVVKPSNWMNPLLPHLMGEPEQMRAVFITVEPRDYLLAAFRGGRERLEFVIRSAFHFLAGCRNRQELLAEAAAVADPLGRAARFALLAHRLQAELFAGAGPVGDCRLSFTEIDRDPLGSAMRAARMLDLDNSAQDIEQAWQRVSGRNVKQSVGSWSQGGREQLHAEIEAAHKQRFRDALQWSEQRLALIASD